MALDITNKVVIITGASSGIGRQCAITCAQNGAKLALLGRNPVSLAETISLLPKSCKHFSYVCDFDEQPDYDILAKSIVTKLGPVTSIIHSAAIPSTIAFRTIGQETIDYLYKINIKSPLVFTRSLIKSGIISTSGASIIFISSVMGVVGESGKSLYSMSKGALLAASKSLAIELAPKKIRVNCISPGVVRSPMSMKSVYSQDFDSMRKVEMLHPLGFGGVEDVANSCLFLIADESKWITGINLIVDGGYTAK